MAENQREANTPLTLYRRLFPSAARHGLPTQPDH